MNIKFYTFPQILDEIYHELFFLLVDSIDEETDYINISKFFVKASGSESKELAIEFITILKMEEIIFEHNNHNFIFSNKYYETENIA